MNHAIRVLQRLTGLGSKPAECGADAGPERVAAKEEPSKPTAAAQRANISFSFHLWVGVLPTEHPRKHAPFLCPLLQSLMPRTKLLRTPAVERMLVQPGADCIMSLDAVLAYFDVTWPVWGYALSLVIYLLIVHGLTFIGLCRLAYKERR